jgi:hypothetical protein
LLFVRLLNRIMMESVVGPAIDEVKQSLSSAIERRMKGQFDELQRREKELQAWEAQLRAREQAVEQRERELAAGNNSTAPSVASGLFKPPATQQAPAPKPAGLFGQMAVGTASSQEQEPKRVSFSETAASEPTVSTSSRSPLFQQPAQPATAAPTVSTSSRGPALFQQPAQPAAAAPQVSTSSRSPLFQQPAQPVVAAPQGQNQLSSQEAVQSQATPNEKPSGCTSES